MVESVRVTVTVEVGVAIERQLQAVETALQAMLLRTFGQPGQLLEMETQAEVDEDLEVAKLLLEVEVVLTLLLLVNVVEGPLPPRATLRARLSLTADGMHVVMAVPLQTKLAFYSTTMLGDTDEVE